LKRLCPKFLDSGDDHDNATATFCARS
jgi:hypothetical protein